MELLHADACRLQASQLSFVFGQIIVRETDRGERELWVECCTVLNISNLFSSSTAVLCARVSFSPWCCNCSGQELMPQCSFEPARSIGAVCYSVRGIL